MPVMFLTLATCRLNDLRKPPPATEHQSQSLKRKIGRYVRYLRNFDRRLGFPGHLRWHFWRRQRVISSKNDGASPWQLLLLLAAEPLSRSLKCKIARMRNICWISIYQIGLPDHIRRFFLRRQCVISSKIDGTSPWQLPVAVSHEASVATFSVLQFRGISKVLHVHSTIYFA